MDGACWRWLTSVGEAGTITFIVAGEEHGAMMEGVMGSMAGIESVPIYIPSTDI